MTQQRGHRATGAEAPSDTVSPPLPLGEGAGGSGETPVENSPSPRGERGPGGEGAPDAVFQAPTDAEAVERARQSVATRVAAPAAADVEAIRALDADTRRALYALLSSLADNKYVLGRRYGEWCTGAPMLESAVAAAAMAQDELGHARSFYPLLRAFPEATEADTTEEQGWQNRPTTAMRCLDARFASWHDFVAANFLVDTALTVLFEAATDSSYEPLRQRARKILQEEQPHWVHAEGWVRRLAKDAQTRKSLVASVEAMWDHAFTWYGQSDDPVIQQLADSGLLGCASDALRDRLRARIAQLLESTGLAADMDVYAQTEAPGMGGWMETSHLATDLLTSRLPWDRWDPDTRRLQ